MLTVKTRASNSKCDIWTPEDPGPRDPGTRAWGPKIWRHGSGDPDTGTGDPDPGKRGSGHGDWHSVWGDRCKVSPHNVG